MVYEPSSATLFAAPGASISKSISYPDAYSGSLWEVNPSFLTLAALESLCIF